MPKPHGNFNYDKFLTNMLVGYRNEEASYGHLAVPVVLHDQLGGQYPVINHEDWLRVMAGVRPRGTAAHMSGFGIDKTSFDCVPIGYKQPVDIDDASSAKDPVDLDLAATIHVGDQLLMKNEADFTTAIMSDTSWSHTIQAGVTGTPSTNQFKRWNESAADPGAIIASLASTVKQKTGKRPNVLWVSDDVDAAVRFNAAVVDRVKYTDPQAIDNNRVTDPVAMAKYFGVRKYVVCGATRNTANEGGTAAFSFFASNRAVLAYVDMPGEGSQPLSMANAKFRPTAVVAVRQDLVRGVNGKRVRAYEDEIIKSRVVEGDEAYLYLKPVEKNGTNSSNSLGIGLKQVIAA